MKIVVDTNVAIAANGRNTHAGIDCQLACIDFLESTVQSRNSTVVLDSNGLILEEYKKHLKHRGAPGVGDMFYKFLHDHMGQPHQVLSVEIHPTLDDDRGFEELSPNQLDRSDRKFLAAAVASDAAVVNAVDTDWFIQSAFVEAEGIAVTQLCPEHGCVN